MNKDICILYIYIHIYIYIHLIGNVGFSMGVWVNPYVSNELRSPRHRLFFLVLDYIFCGAQNPSMLTPKDSANEVLYMCVGEVRKNTGFTWRRSENEDQNCWWLQSGYLEDHPTPHLLAMNGHLEGEPPSNHPRCIKPCQQCVEASP